MNYSEIYHQFLNIDNLSDIRSIEHFLPMNTTLDALPLDIQDFFVNNPTKQSIYKVRKYGGSYICEFIVRPDINKDLFISAYASFFEHIVVAFVNAMDVIQPMIKQIGRLNSSEWRYELTNSEELKQKCPCLSSLISTYNNRYRTDEFLFDQYTLWSFPMDNTLMIAYVDLVELYSDLKEITQKFSSLVNICEKVCTEISNVGYLNSYTNGKIQDFFRMARACLLLS